jgi:transcriptional regulator with XRE-family HTH domain
MITPLQAHREKLGQVQRHVAVALGIDPSHYRRVELALVQASPELANRIAKYFGNAITRDQILYPEDYAAAPLRKPARQLQAAG